MATLGLELVHLTCPARVALCGVIRALRFLVAFLFIVLFLGKLATRILLTRCACLCTVTLKVIVLPFRVVSVMRAVPGLFALMVSTLLEFCLMFREPLALPATSVATFLFVVLQLTVTLVLVFPLTAIGFLKLVFCLIRKVRTLESILVGAACTLRVNRAVLFPSAVRTVITAAPGLSALT